MFIESPRKVYRNNPLKEVVWQAKFPPILAIAVNEPVKFQDAIRHRFPHYRAESTFEIPADQVRTLSRAGVEVEGKQSHRFETKSRDITVTLTDQFIAISTTNYSDWDSFFQSVQSVFNQFSELYEPAFISRLGVRYINLVDRSELGILEVPWRDLIEEQFLGPLMAESYSDKVNEYRAMALFDLPVVEGAMARINFGLEEKQIFRLDADLSLQGEIEKEELYDHSREFNTQIGYIFRSAIKQKLEDALDPAN